MIYPTSVRNTKVIALDYVENSTELLLYINILLNVKH